MDFTKITTTQFYVAANTLPAGKTYRIKYKLENLNDPTRSLELLYEFMVGSQPLVATIAGGSQSEVSVLSDFQIDATESIDPDEAGDLQTSGLTYTWACTLYDAVTEKESACVALDGRALALPSTATVKISAGTLAVTTTDPYKFTVTVSKAGKEPATATKSMHISADPIPVVSLQPHHSLQRKKGEIYINAVDQVIFRGSCTSTVNSSDAVKTFTWSLKDVSGRQIDTSNADIFTLGANDLNFVMLGDSGLISGGGTVSSCNIYVFLYVIGLVQVYISYAHIFKYIYIFKNAYIHTYIHTFSCMRIYIYIYIYTHTHTHIHTSVLAIHVSSLS